MDMGYDDVAYQERILPHVSRTFALTIPQLPPALQVAVTNAYLLCRIADTVEDEPAISPEETHSLLQRFGAVVAGCDDPSPLAVGLAARLSERTLPMERDLIAHMDSVIRVTARLGDAERRAIARCVELMCRGMPRFQSTASLAGLATIDDLGEYCYYVAGVVGEMLTELFCAYSGEIARNRAGLARFSISFAQGLQMTNILKDVWEDRSRGACWLPRDVFGRHGVVIADLDRLAPTAGFASAIAELVAVAHAHLRYALEYTLLIPPRETGIRRFCLWAIGLAVLTLRKIRANPRYTSGREVKISRRAVAATRAATGLALRSDAMLRQLFAAAARGLPLAAIEPSARPASAASAAAPLFEAAATDAAGELACAGLRP